MLFAGWVLKFGRLVDDDTVAFDAGGIAVFKADCRTLLPSGR